MIPDALDFILRPTNDEQAEYAAAHKTPAPEPEGEASTGAVKKSASPSLPRRGGADAESLDAGSVGASASRVPQWSAVDDETADLLSLVASEHPAIPGESDEWTYFVRVLQDVAMADGLIDQNVTRPLLRGEVAPRRIGAFYHRATKSGLIRAEGWNTSNDLEGKNGGKPTKVYRWLGVSS